MSTPRAPTRRSAAETWEHLVQEAGEEFLAMLGARREPEPGAGGRRDGGGPK